MTHSKNHLESDIAQFVLMHRSRGAFLPFEDYWTIRKWVGLCPSRQVLLTVLDRTLPELYRNRDGPRGLPKLSAIDRRVQRLIKVAAKAES